MENAEQNQTCSHAELAGECELKVKLGLLSKHDNVCHNPLRMIICFFLFSTPFREPDSIKRNYQGKKIEQKGRFTAIGFSSPWRLAKCFAHRGYSIIILS